MDNMTKNVLFHRKWSSTTVVIEKVSQVVTNTAACSHDQFVTYSSNKESGFTSFDSGTTIREDVTEVWEMRLARNRRNLTHGGSQTHYGIPTDVLEPSVTASDRHVHGTIRPCEEVRLLEKTWQQRELTLGQTIQHLAEENMRLAIARQTAEKEMAEKHAKLEAELQHTSEELNRLRTEAEKTQQVFEKLHTQLQAGREDRQMITLEMERIRSAFDAEREAKEEMITEMRKLREERDENRREVENIKEQLMHERKVVEETTTMLNVEREEKNCAIKESERLRDELKNVKRPLVATTIGLQPQDVPQQQELHAGESAGTEGPALRRVRSPEVKAELERFQAEMGTIREIRQRVMHAVSSEMERLRTELNVEREARQQLEQTVLHTGSSEKSKKEETLTLELAQIQQKMRADKKRLKQLSQENERLQFELDNGRQILTERTEDLEKLQMQLECEREQFQNQIVALKEVAAISKQMVIIRETQVARLKEKLKEIEASVTNKVHEKLSVDLKAEYESQMENIRSLKGLYEERMKVMLSEKEKLVQDSEEKSQHLQAEMKKSAEFEQQLAEMKVSLSQKEEENSNLQIQLDDSYDKSQGLANELSHINNLFTQMLVGSTSSDMDLDKLTRLLQENHDLITEITIKEDSSEAAAVLPKLLLDLVTQVDSGTASASSSPTGERIDDNQVELDTQTSPLLHDLTAEDVPEVNSKSSEECATSIAVEDIALNLRKVWKVLMELLSHHVPPSCVGEHDDSKSSCYKSVDTPSGPRLVISVSKTFLHLKDLILEKKSLQKELTRLKQLNGHLESKLNDQEHKLSLVSSELRKTWNVVDLMQTQHQQLHTHEKILRYELHEKRKMLNELKQELEYCREKWERARQKNSESEEEWRKLRKEFASRKNQPIDLLNNSGESGFSDERGDESCEDDDDDDDDGICKGTGQLNPGIEDLSNLSDASGIVRTSSPLDSNLPQPCLLLGSSNVCEANMSGGACGQSELILHEPTLSRRETIPESSPACEHTNILNHSEPELALDLETVSFPNSGCSNSESDVHQETYHIEQQSNSTGMCCETFENNMKQEHASDCRLEPPVIGDCSTISLITLLKQQLSFFSRNLDYVTAGADDISGHNLQALESIFSLPPIQIPTSLNDNITKQDHVQSLYCYGQGDSLHFSSLPQSPSLSTMPDLSNDDRFTKCVCSTVKSEHKMVSGKTESLEENSTPTESLLENVTLEDKNSTTTCTTDKSSLLQEPSDENKSCYQLNSCEKSSSSEKLGAVESLQPLKVSRTAEEIAEARAARLKRLEEQCQQLYNKVTRTTYRSSALCNRLEELHEQYGSMTNSESNIPVPPPMPLVLKARRIPTSVPLTERNNLGESVLPATTASSSFLQTPFVMEPPTNAEQNETIYSRETADTSGIPTPPPYPHRPEFSNDDKFTECVYSAVKSEPELVSGKIESPEENSTPTESLLENITSEDRNNTTRTTDESTLLQEPSDENKPCNRQNSYEESSSSEKLGAVESLQPLKVNRTAEEIAEARAARLKRLEEQCQQLYNKVTRTTYRSSALCNRLEELHEQYGSVTGTESNIPAPPPMPHVVKARHIPTSAPLTERNNLGESMLSATTASSSFLQAPYSRGLPTGTEQNETNYSRETAETNSIPTPPPFPDNLHPRQTQISDVEGQSGSTSIPTHPPLPHVLRGRLLSTYSVQSQSSNSESHDGTAHSADESTTQRIPSIMQTQEEMLDETFTNDGNHSDSNLK
ncbi:hypothetical protein Cfor_04064 [Coptotermes formosanus]|uniref:Uncharacterized protein n=1 Tax=Coptotermes formosanus TaxID=36987 RepID=A0A6L2PSG0_COPFO|nr:hypothetical protein Cfor_04064 [Coptotermes formosanus]